MLGLKLNHVSKRGHWKKPLSETMKTQFTYIYMHLLASFFYELVILCNLQTQQVDLISHNGIFSIGKMTPLHLVRATVIMVLFPG